MIDQNHELLFALADTSILEQLLGLYAPSSIQPNTMRIWLNMAFITDAEVISRIRNLNESGVYIRILTKGDVSEGAVSQFKQDGIEVGEIMKEDTVDHHDKTLTIEWVEDGRKRSIAIAGSTNLLKSTPKSDEVSFAFKDNQEVTKQIQNQLLSWDNLFAR